MNLDYQSLIPQDFHASSRVWVYQAPRLFGFSEALEIEGLLNEFVENWQSHGEAVKGFANLFFGQFIILMADETQAGVSGCSTDSSVRLIKTIEQQFNVPMFDRQSLAFLVKEKVQILPMQQLNYAIQNQFIDLNTIYFNNLVQTKQQLLHEWMIPVEKSWLSKKIKSVV